MGWIEWCSVLLGGPIFRLLDWLLSWLFRDNTLRLQNAAIIGSTSAQLAGLQSSLSTLEAIQARLGNLQPADLEARVVAMQNERNQYAIELEALRKRIEAVAGERDRQQAALEGLQKRPGQPSGRGGRCQNRQRSHQRLHPFL